MDHPERGRDIAHGIARTKGVALQVPDVWAIETPSFGSKGQLDRLYSGWWGVIDELMRWGGWPPPLRVAPSQVKKFATGKGNTGKDEVMLAVARRFPDVNVSNNNETDALVLAAIAAAVHGEPFAGTLTKYQQEVVDAVRAGAKEEQ